MQSTAALLTLAALAFTVTTGRKLVESESEGNKLREERMHPNSVYSMMDQLHSTKEKSRAKSKYNKGKEGVKIFYQTGVSNPSCKQ